MILVFGYVMVTLLLYFSTIGSPATPVTPTLVVWAYALFINFVHVAILAAVAYRWLTIRDEVLAWAPRRPAPQARGRRPAGLR